jgi:hypothetical protein
MTDYLARIKDSETGPFLVGVCILMLLFAIRFVFDGVISFIKELLLYSRSTSLCCTIRYLIMTSQLSDSDGRFLLI